MVCPFCFYKKTRVYNTRGGTQLNAVWRRRECPNCTAQFTTYEKAAIDSILTIKEGKELIPFSHALLLLELVKVCDHREDLDKTVIYLADTIEQKLFRQLAKTENKIITRDDIFYAISKTLELYDPIAHIKYASNKQKGISAAILKRVVKK